jgi:2-haloacid dehalogenase
MLYPGKGAELSNVWRTRQFEYQWLRALAGHYADFWQTTEEGLVFAAKLLKLELTLEKRAQLMDAYLGLKAWPEVPSALRALREAGIRLAFVSNMTAKMLEGGIKNAGLDGFFEYVLSTDQLRAYKPDPRAYQMAIDAFKLKREEILFTAFAGWDVAGAKWFGYPTFWVQSPQSPGRRVGSSAGWDGARPDGPGDFRHDTTLEGSRQPGGEARTLSRTVCKSARGSSPAVPYLMATTTFCGECLWSSSCSTSHPRRGWRT